MQTLVRRTKKRLCCHDSKIQDTRTRLLFYLPFLLLRKEKLHFYQLAWPLAAHKRSSEEALLPKTSENLLDIDTLSIHLLPATCYECPLSIDICIRSSYYCSLNALFGKRNETSCEQKVMEKKNVQRKNVSKSFYYNIFCGVQGNSIKTGSIEKASQHFEFLVT